MKLYDYQEQVIHKSRIAIRDGFKRICITAPTGAGKTVIMGAIAEAVVKKGGVAVICVSLDALVPQTSDKLERFGIDHGFIKAGYSEDRGASVHVASIQTMARRQWWRDLSPTVVLWDEAHVTPFSKIGRRAIFEDWGQSIHLGMTATPLRTKRTEGMADIFQTLIQGPLPCDLQEMGKLSKMKYYSTSQKADLSGVRTLMGDYNEGQLSLQVNTPKMIADAIFHWERLSQRQRTLVFCVDVAHANAVLAAFLEKGISAAIVVGDTPKKERDRIYADFDAGWITVLVSVNVLSIGFDSPRAAVGLMLRPTKSLSLHLQQVGRIMRVHPDKPHGIIIDQAGNCQAHILPEDLPTWELDAAKPPQPAPTKDCPSCTAIIPAVAQVCPECGYVFPWGGEDQQEAAPTDLVEVKSAKEIHRAKRREWYQERCRRAYAQGKAIGYASVKYKEKFGQWPSMAWRRGALFGGESDWRQRQQFHDFLKFKSMLKDDPQDWLKKEWEREFGEEYPLSEVAPLGSFAMEGT